MPERCSWELGNKVHSNMVKIVENPIRFGLKMTFSTTQQLVKQTVFIDGRVLCLAYTGFDVCLDLKEMKVVGYTNAKSLDVTLSTKSIGHDILFSIIVLFVDFVLFKCTILFKYNRRECHMSKIQGRDVYGWHTNLKHFHILVSKDR
ncbi:hypothetical protein HanPI659440_Chr09g0344671 [Helianthus annuus]|nr:hypothetical protein HanPI659440_Chr09g0344671 [Helianthus annuus]